MHKVKGFKRFLLEYTLVILTIVVVALLSTQYYFSYKMVLDFVTKKFDYLAKQSSLIVKEKDDHAKEIVSILRNVPIVNSKESFEKKEVLLKLFTTPIQHNPKIFAIYIAYPDSKYFEVVNIGHSSFIAKMFHAPKDAQWIVVQLYRDNPTQLTATEVAHFYDKKFHYLSSFTKITDYNPLKRPWYKEALSGKGTIVRGSPYMYYRLQKMGITYSTPLSDEKSIIAMDMTLDVLSQSLRHLKDSTQTDIYMFEDQKLIASSIESAEGDVDAELLEAVKRGSNQIKSYKKEGKTYFYTVIPISSHIKLAFKAEKSRMMQPYMRSIYAELIVTFILLLLFIPLIRKLSQGFVKRIEMLMAENEKVKNREFDKVTPIKSDIYELNLLSDSLVEMSKSIKEHEEKQEKLLEAFIHLIANMIDSKSPYTGEHCKKVPILTKMILDEVNESQVDMLKDFHIDDKEILKGIEWSSWLHDCGKLIIPNDIIDKATKLEVVYNRIHEIRTRFEVLLRDAQIKYLRAIIDGESQENAKKEFECTKEQLQSDFEFIAEINLGERTLTDEEYARLLQISSITWERNFSKQIGISWQEKALIQKAEKEERLPAQEQLLYDGKEHEIERMQSDLQLYEKEHIKMEVPKLLYNKGEIYNLSIPIGTITTEEKFKIQEHAIHTLKILKELPWSEKLKYIVEDAANHHEHLDGTGYPRLLHENRLSVPARIMAIADIFEALTAVNRPYKRSKTLSEAIDMMVEMVESHNIDREIFKLFINNKIYLKYAKAYLKESQIDLENIDEEKIIKALEEF
jgi:HD-GYP domain-containing protein (c-di-GMP phosphodiesterase class II)